MVRCGQELYDQWCYSKILIFKSLNFRLAFYKRIFALVTKNSVETFNEVFTEVSTIRSNLM